MEWHARIVNTTTDKTRGVTVKAHLISGALEEISLEIGELIVSIVSDHDESAMWD